MVGVLERVDVSALLATAHNVADDMQAADLTVVSDDCLLDQLRKFERLQRRLTMVGYALISEVDARALPSVYGAKTMASFLSGLLRIDGRIYWRPPKWLDKAQRPIRNRLHDPG